MTSQVAGKREDVPEEHVSIRKETLLETDDDKLATLEPVAEELPDVLGVRQVECGVNLVEDVHRRRLKLQEGHNERERNERPVWAIRIRAERRYIGKLPRTVGHH